MKAIFRFFENVWIRFFKGPEKNEYLPEMAVDTFCPACNWSGSYVMTLIEDKTNDKCPNCGNTYLDYII